MVMASYEVTLQDIMDTVSEWHDHEGIDPVENKLLAIFCVYAHIHFNSPNPDYPSQDLNPLRVAVEAAFQLGRAVGRDQDYSTID
jgi:hypothetical protein